MLVILVVVMRSVKCGYGDTIYLVKGPGVNYGLKPTLSSSGPVWSLIT